MNKLRLDLEALDVESFASETSAPQAVAGTVRAHESLRMCPTFPVPTDDTGTIQTGPFLC